MSNDDEPIARSAAGARHLGRRRRANVDGGRRHSHRVRVTPEEEAVLLRLSEDQGVTIVRLLVESALAAGSGETPTERRHAMAQLFGIQRLLASLSNNINQIARATNATGEVHEELVSTLRAVRRVALRTDAALDGLIGEGRST